MVFPTFFNFSLNLAMSSLSEPQSAPGLVFADCDGDVHASSLLLCHWKRVFAMTSAFSWHNSVSLGPASFCTPRPNMPVTPGIS